MFWNDCHHFYLLSLKKYQFDEIHLIVIVFMLGFLYCNDVYESLVAVVFVVIAVALLGSLDFVGTHPSYECFLLCDTCSIFHCCICSDHCTVFDCFHCNLMILVSLQFLSSLCNIGPIVEHW